MKLKLNGLKLNDANFKTEMNIATFNENLLPFFQQKIVVDHNFGKNFLKIYEKYRSNLILENISKMIQEMEDDFRKYQFDLLSLKREKI